MPAPNLAVDPSVLVYDPAEITRIGTKYLEDRKERKQTGIPVYLKSIDDVLIPVLRGELISLIGRPGCGKTGFMMRWARYRARELRTQGIKDKVVGYATWEQSVEELHAFHVAAEAKLSITNMA